MRYHLTLRIDHIGPSGRMEDVFNASIRWVEVALVPYIFASLILSIFHLGFRIYQSHGPIGARNNKSVLTLICSY